MTAAAELFGHRGDVDPRAAAETDFHALVQLLDRDKGTLRTADLQTLVDEVFGIDRAGPTAVEIAASTQV